MGKVSKRKVTTKRLSKVPMGIPFAAIAKAAHTAYEVGKVLKPIAKKIYNHPKVQSKWKGFKNKHHLNWLPFGPNHPTLKPRHYEKFSKEAKDHYDKYGRVPTVKPPKIMGKVNMHKYKKGTMMT